VAPTRLLDPVRIQWPDRHTTVPVSPASVVQAGASRQGASLCGHGYLQGSYLCTACAPRFFLEDSGACTACPVLASAWQRYSGLLYICMAIVGIVALVYAILAILVFCVGGTITGGLFRMSNLALWALMCAQVRVRVLSCTQSVAQSHVFPLGCIGCCHCRLTLTATPCCCSVQGYRGAAAAGCAPASSLHWLAPFWHRHIHYVCRPESLGRIDRSLSMRLAGPSCATLGQFALMWAMVLYPSASLAAMQLLQCQQVTLSALGAAGLDGGPYDSLRLVR